jgi:hypothetical protein
MKEQNVSGLGSDAVLPEQFFDTLRRSERMQPEKALFVAILQDAIHSYRKHASARDRVGKERFQEVESWIMQTEEDWIFSFQNVCELLGLDPEYLRRGLEKWRAKTLAQEKGRRRHERKQAA